MNSEEIFQINQKINRIKRNLQIREQKASEWIVPYQKVLKQKPDKTVYLSKTTQNFRHSQACPDKQENYNLKSCDYTQRKQALTKKVKQSRKKIKEHYNQLKQLDELTKKKTKIRQLTLKQQEQKKQNQELTKQLSKTFTNNLKINTKTIASMNGAKMKKSSKQFSNNQLEKSCSTQDNFFGLNMTSSGLFSQTFSPGAFSSINLNSIGMRTVKDRVNPFSNVKADKFIQIYQDLKSQNKVNQEGMAQVFKTFGIGLQNTPYSTMMKKRQLKAKRDGASGHNHNSPNTKQQKQSISSVQLETERDHVLTQSIKSSKSHKCDKNKVKLQCKQNLPKALQKLIHQKENIYTAVGNQGLVKFCENNVKKTKIHKSARNKPNIFQNRMKKILKYHGDFWSDNFQHGNSKQKGGSFQHTYDKFMQTINLHQTMQFKNQ